VTNGPYPPPESPLLKAATIPIVVTLDQLKFDTLVVLLLPGVEQLGRALQCKAEPGLGEITAIQDNLRADNGLSCLKEYAELHLRKRRQQ